MSFDNSRHIFNPYKDYSSVVLPQGRVQSDADWNELLDEITRRIQAGTLDIMGRAAYTQTTPDAFFISPGSTPWVVNIGLGRMYVDGLLAENHGVPPGIWDPALEELSGVPQPQPATVSDTPSIPFTSQPYLPAAAASISGAAQYLPTGAGTYVYYLDVWKRAVTWLQDSELIDSAIGIDTSGRIQTAWQVRWTTANATDGVTGCAIPDSEIAYPAQSAGQLTTQALPNPASGPCCLTPGSGYTGLENQFYRVQIHKGGPLGTATYKWSRENASVTTSVTGIANKGNAAGKQATVLTVTSLGRDQVLNFSNGNWIELLDDSVELDGMPDPNYPSAGPYIYGNPGLLCQIDYVEPTTNEIYLVAPPLTDPRFAIGTPETEVHTRIVRWDQAGTVYSSDASGTQTATTNAQSTGDILTPGDGTTMLVLENGIVATFSVSAAEGNFLSGDYWTFAARTDGTLDQPLQAAPPRGIQHHYTKLSVVTFDGSGAATNTPDCRTQFGCGCKSDCGCCTVTVGDNVNSFGAYSSIQQAIYNLPTTGGVVCILPGKYYELVVLSGVSEVTLKGSGPQTILYPPSSRPPGTADQGGNTLAPTTQSGLNAVVTVGGSQHVELTGFTVEAPEGFTGILLDTIEEDIQIEVAKQNSVEQHADLLAKKTKMSNAAPQTEAGQKAAQANEQQTPGMVQKLKPSQDISGVTVQKHYGGATNWTSNGAGYAWATPTTTASNTDVLVKDVVVTAANFPAIASVQAQAVRICDNRIFMQDTPGLWPAVYVSGSETSVARNWIGLEDIEDASIVASEAVQADLAPNFVVSLTPAVGNGGVQVGGFSDTIEIVENHIEGGAFNAISLGGYVLINDGSQATGLQGLFPELPAAAGAQNSLMLPEITANSQVAADGPLQNIRIEKNRITNFGLCGIGPVGYFMTREPETISIANLSILANNLSSTMQAVPAELPDLLAGTIGYGAISLPDLQNTVIRDNVITDFGSEPGAQVCGIFVLNGEQLDISRNQIVETRDWVALNTEPPAANGGQQAGIAIAMVSPPALSQAAQTWTGASAQGETTAGSPPIYQPGMPALRVEQNVVRIPLGYSLTVLGYGPFSISSNQFSTGGTVPWAGGTPPIALNVFVLNLGLAVEFDKVTSFASLWDMTSGGYAPPSLTTVDNSVASSSCGTILFAHNQCQVETRGSGAGAPFSILILTLDHLDFSNNLSWIDGTGITLPGAAPGEPGTSLAALSDVFLFGLSLQVTSNRLQETALRVLASGVTVGLLNVTSNNISTMCLFPRGGQVAAANNLSYFSADVCKDKSQALLLEILYGSLTSGATLPVQLASAAATGAETATPSMPAEASAPQPGPSDSQPATTTSYATTSPDRLMQTPKPLIQADSSSAKGLQQLAQTHQARLAQVTRIAATITKQAGAGSAQATAAQAVVVSSQASVARVAMMRQRVTAAAPTVPSTGWGIYGTVYNSSNAPVQGYSVYFVDSTNTYQNTYGIAYTQADGSYQFVYAGPPAGGSAPSPSDLYLQVADAGGNPIYTSATASAPTIGVASYLAITLPVGEKPLGKLPIVLRSVTLPDANKDIGPASEESGEK